MTTLAIETINDQVGSTATVTVNGTQVFNGTVASGVSVGTLTDLCSFDASNGDEVVITLTSGNARMGWTGYTRTARAWSASKAYSASDLVSDTDGTIFQALQSVPAGTLLTDTNYWSNQGKDSADVRTNIQINGANPVYPSGPIYPNPSDPNTPDPSNPVWSYWFFILNAGDTCSFTVSL